MNTPGLDTPQPSHTPNPQRSRAHPAMIAAAIAVILLCLVGTAAILGWIPSALKGGANRDGLSDFDKAALAAKMQQDANRSSSPALVMAPAELPSTALPPASVPPASQPSNTSALERGLVERDGEYEDVREPVREPAPRERVVERVVEREEPARREPVRVAEAKPERDWCKTCGSVESVRAIKERAQGSGLGAAGGAVLGGLLGNQIGGGNGRKLATVAGAVGGAVVGNQVEGNMKATTSYEIRVRLDDGSSRTFHQQSAPRWEAGDRVKVVKGSLRSAA